MKCSWEDTTAKAHNHYVNKVSEVILLSQHPACKDHAILHRKPFGITLMTNDKVSQFLQIPKQINLV